MAKCDICKEEHSGATQSCSACNKAVKKYQNKTKYPMEKVRDALNHAYSHKGMDNNESHFKCEYTGIVSKFNSKNETLGTSKDAFILTLDHKDSGSKELVVSLNIINKMKHPQNVRIFSSNWKSILRRFAWAEVFILSHSIFLLFPIPITETNVHL